MSPKTIDPAQEILEDKTGDIAKLRELGITDFALATYVVRVQDGRSKEEALRGLLLGRSLNAEQELFVRVVLHRVSVPRPKESRTYRTPRVSGQRLGGPGSHRWRKLSTTDGIADGYRRKASRKK